MLTGVVLPEVARPSRAPLPPVLRDSFRSIDGASDVSRRATEHAVFTVPGEPSAARWFLATHLPAGFVGRGGGGDTTDTQRGLRSWFLQQDLGVLPANTNRAGVSIGIEAQDGRVVLFLEASVIWADLRPVDTFASERDGVVIVTVVRDEPGTHVIRRVVVTDRTQVAAIVRSFNALPAALPGPPSCTGPLPGVVRYRIAFAAAQTATPDRTVLVGGMCGIGIMVGGSHYYLEDSNAAFGRAVGRVLGQPGYLSFIE
jgi:hypothetical protein